MNEERKPAPRRGFLSKRDAIEIAKEHLGPFEDCGIELKRNPDNWEITIQKRYGEDNIKIKIDAHSGEIIP